MLMDQTNLVCKREINLQTTWPEYISTKLRMHVETQIPAVQVRFGPGKSAHTPWPEQREKLEQEGQAGPAAGRREASVDLSPVPTFMAATGCHPAAGLHLIGRGSEQGCGVQEGLACKGCWEVPSSDGRARGGQ